ncbi:TPA: hypothetical protein ACGO48_002187, partial [Streptococcus suis]
KISVRPSIFSLSFTSFVSGHDMSHKNRYYFCDELVRYLGKSQIAIAVVGAGKNSTGRKRIRLPAPAQLIRPDLMCETRTNLPINHCAEMLTQTLSNKTKLFNHHTGTLIEHGYDTLQNCQTES